MLDYLSHFISVYGQECYPGGDLKQEDGINPPLISFLLNSNQVVAIINGLPISSRGKIFELGNSYFTNVTFAR